MKPGTLITSLIGDRPHITFAFGDPAEQGITDPFYPFEGRTGLFSEGIERHSLAGLGLKLDQQKAVALGLCPYVIIRTKDVFAEQDYSPEAFQRIGTAFPEEVEWEHSHAFCDKREQRRLIKRFFRKLQGRFRNENFLHATGHGGSSSFFPVRRGDRFVFAFFSLKPVPADQTLVTA